MTGKRIAGVGNRSAAADPRVSSRDDTRTSSRGAAESKLGDNDTPVKPPASHPRHQAPAPARGYSGDDP